MSIRLNKALSELNIGLQTAVELLERRKDLGPVEAKPSFKLNDEQYAALVKAFKNEANVRKEAEKLFKKPKEKKPAEPKKEDTRAEALLGSSARQQYKPLGKIDLDNLGNKPDAQKAPEQSDAASQAQTPKSEPQAAAVSPEPAKTEPATDVKPAETKPAEPNAETPKTEEKVAKAEPVEQKAEPVEQKPEENVGQKTEKAEKTESIESTARPTKPEAPVKEEAKPTEETKPTEEA